MSEAWRPAGRIVVTLTAVTILLLAGLAITHAPSTEARMFTASVVDLTLEGPRGVNAFLTGTNMAPGDRVSGELRLFSESDGTGETLDLDFVVRSEGATALGDVLFLTRIEYGNQDILDGPMRSLLNEHGGPDGRLSLMELGSVTADLPPPAIRAKGGTKLVFEVELDRTLRNTIVGSLTSEFVFQLGDVLAPDLE